jgi:glycosyltransferase involved in cell wall biosynthesis
MKRNKKVLYLSYDGLSDHIGQSQVLPYLLACRQGGINLDAITFEKKANQQRIDQIQALLDERGIKWHRLSFSTGGNLAKIYDFIRFFFKAFWINIRHRYSIIHCRSYTSANVGLLIRYVTGRKLIFDTRDFWIDAKVETGRIDLSKPAHRMVHSFLRFFEKRLFRRADHIVSLTEKAKQVLLKQYPMRKPEDITVIPCCVDLSLFAPANIPADNTLALRRELGLEGALVLGYVGSIGPAYMVPRLLECFRMINEPMPEARLLFLINNDREEVYKVADEVGVSRDHIVVTSAPRASMPLYISMLDAGIFFVTPSFAKQSTSPTKLFEMLAMGKPVITNAGVGDAEKIFREMPGNYLLPEVTTAAFADAVTWLQNHRREKPVFDLSCYSLDYGAERYLGVYRKLLEEA